MSRRSDISPLVQQEVRWKLRLDRSRTRPLLAFHVYMRTELDRPRRLRLRRSPSIQTYHDKFGLQFAFLASFSRDHRGCLRQGNVRQGTTSYRTASSWSRRSRSSRWRVAKTNSSRGLLLSLCSLADHGRQLFDPSAAVSLRKCFANNHYAHPWKSRSKILRDRTVFAQQECWNVSTLRRMSKPRGMQAASP